MCDDQVQPAVSGGIRGICAHAGLELAVRTDRDTSQISHFAKRTITVVVKQEVRHVVIGDEDVLPTVVVVVEGYDAQAVPAFKANSGRLADVCEGAIAVVVIKRRRLTVKVVRMAVAAHAGSTIAAIEVPRHGPIDVISNYQVQFSVVVVIEPGSARCPPSGIFHACVRANVAESSVPV